jgi:hypothetical protein
MTIWDLVERYVEAADRVNVPEPGDVTERRKEYQATRDAARTAIAELEREHGDLVANHRIVCKALGLCDYADGRGYLYAYPDEVNRALVNLERQHAALLSVYRAAQRYTSNPPPDVPQQQLFGQIVTAGNDLLAALQDCRQVLEQS